MNETGIMASRIFGSLLALAPQILIFAALIFYLNKKKGSDGILMIIGTVIGILVTVFNMFVLPYLLEMRFDRGIVENAVITTVPNFLSVIGSILFAIGFFIMFYNLFKKGKGIKDDLNERIEKINVKQDDF